ncbi:MAG: hypothetical protein KKH94_11525 [Candidatus Omnitrophica bacterium]|nr:hypothetical protein [Candidatus Omnitrophota bacterium]
MLTTEEISEILKHQESYAVRKANKEEMEQLIDFMFKKSDGIQTEENIREVVNFSYTAVIENYVTDCVGYAGKVLIVIFPASPTMHRIYTLKNNGELEEAIKE